MPNKKDLEKMVINSEKDLMSLHGQDLQNKHLLIKGDVKDIKFKTLKGCIIEGGHLICEKISECSVQNADYVYADVVDKSKFYKCNRIRLGDADSHNPITESIFINCTTIELEDVKAIGCTFSDFETLYITWTDLHNCTISDVVCHNDCAIVMEDGEISNCTFTNIKLRNGSYLIEGYGNPWVETSVFEDISTAKPDKELFHLEETKGIIFKRKKEYCFTDEDSCLGLDQVKLLS